MPFTKLIEQISIWSILLPLIVGCFDVRRLDEPSRYIFLLVLLATPPQLLTWHLPNHQQNAIYNVYTVLEFIVIYRLLAYGLTTPWLRLITWGSILGFGTTVIVSIIYFGWYQKWWNELVCVANTSYLIWVFFYILEELLADRPLIQPEQPMFWYLAGLLLYTPCTIFVVALSYYIKDSRNILIHNLWSIHGVFNTLMYLLFAVGLHLNSKHFKMQFTGV